MIIYGWRTSVKEGKLLEGVACESCGETTLGVHAACRYAHVYWIPLFPVGRTTHVICESCGHAREGRAISAPVKERIKNENARPAIPIYHFTGLAVGLVALLWPTVASAF